MGLPGHTDDQHPKSLTEAWLTGTRKDRLQAQPSDLREATLALPGCDPWAGTRAGGQSWPRSPGLVQREWEATPSSNYGFTCPLGAPLLALLQ